MYYFVYNIGMKKDKGHILNFCLYMLGKKRIKLKNDELDALSPYRHAAADDCNEELNFSILREDSYLLHKDLFIARLQKLPGPDRRRLLNCLAMIEGYTLIKNDPKPPAPER